MLRRDKSGYPFSKMSSHNSRCFIGIHAPAAVSHGGGYASLIQHCRDHARPNLKLHLGSTFPDPGVADTIHHCIIANLGELLERELL